MRRLFQKLARLRTFLLDKDPMTIHRLYRLRLFGTAVFLLWLSFHLFFETVRGFSSKYTSPNVVNYGEGTLNRFAGNRECDIPQSELYFIPTSSDHKTSPFCKNRATLLEALSSGARYDFMEPYVGKGCTYRWFSTTEIHMILERFNAISFIGDESAQATYAAFNILLRQDLAFGGLQAWNMNEQDRELCKCEGQFNNAYCLRYLVSSSLEVEENEGTQKGVFSYGARVPHAFIQINSETRTETSKAFFRELNYFKPSPWQPSPVIFSYNTGPVFDADILDDWLDLASGAERNIPFLYLGPQASEVAGDDDYSTVLKYHMQLKDVAKQRRFDLLSLYNLTLSQVPENVQNSKERTAIVKAMMIMNWLSKLETS